MFWQRWQCYILCWGKPRHSVPSLWALALSDVLLRHIWIHKTYQINKWICMYKMRSTTHQSHDLHITVQHPPPSITNSHCISRSPWCSHASRVSTGGNYETKSSYLTASLLLCAPVNSFYRRKEQTRLMFVCTVCCLGTESNAYKTRELKDKAELKDRKARHI